jgi:hypothetical protein
MIKLSRSTAQLYCIGLQQKPLTDHDRLELGPELSACCDFNDQLRVHFEMAIEKSERTKIPEMILIHIEP